MTDEKAQHEQDIELLRRIHEALGVLNSRLHEAAESGLTVAGRIDYVETPPTWADALVITLDVKRVNG